MLVRVGPCVVPALGLVTGAACGLLVAPPAWHLAALVLALAVAAAGWVRRVEWLLMVALFVGFFLSSLALTADSRDRALNPPLREVLHTAYGGFRMAEVGSEPEHEPIPVRARLLEDATPRDGFVAIRVQILDVARNGIWTPATGGAALSVSGSMQPLGEWTAGRVIEAPVTFSRPDRYLNDGVPDFEREAALAGTALYGSIKSGLLVAVVADGGMSAEMAASARARVRRAVSRWIAPHSQVTAAIVTAILIGDRTGLPVSVRDRLQAAGTYHVIAISGGNIAVLATLVLALLALLGLRGRIGAALAIVAMLVYAFIVVAGPSVWRATLMTLVYLAARVMDHRTSPWQALLLAAAVMVVAQPLELRDAGFILTFGATAALLETGRLTSGAARQRWPVRWLVTPVLASAAIEAALLPVFAQSFSQVTLAGVVLNLLAVPAMAVIQVAGIAVVVFDSFDSAANFAGLIAHRAGVVLLASARLVDVAPWLTARVPPPGVPLMTLYYFFLVGALVGRQSSVRSLAALGIAATAAGIVIAPVWKASDRGDTGVLRLTMFDVGQGEAMLLQLPAGEEYLVDSGGVPFGGGGFDVGERVLLPALWARGVRSLHALLVTHGDPDHIGGARAVTGGLRIRRLWEGIEVAAHGPSDDLRAAARADGATLETLRAGRAIVTGTLRLRVLHPPEPDWERRQVRNDDSVVIEVVYRDVAMLLTGDIGAGVERSLLDALTPSRTRILKVAHHGSRTSSSLELLNAWRPQVALISCGRGNRFGHPTREVLDRLAAIGAKMFRTDRDGQITLETDGRDVSVTTFVGGGP